MKTLTRQEEQILLAVYHLGDRAYVVTIRDLIKQMTGRSYSVGTIYAPLNRLNLKGLLETTQGEPSPSRGGKAITFYHLTKTGTEALEKAKRIQEKWWTDVHFQKTK
jgi:DNA-binding PadR family transcriptional regulator